MAVFKDAKGVEWDINIDAQKIMQVRESADPNFMLNDTDSSNTYTRLERDPAMLCCVIYVLCRSQREDRKVTEEEFYRNVIGDAIDEATDAMLAAITAFTPRRTREVLEASAAACKSLYQHGTKRVIEKVTDQKLQAEILANLDREIDKTISSLLTRPASATDGQESSASTPPG